ncbi:MULTISPECIES: IS481 family transposase [Acidobacteriaceae]|uniref:IS481 family transposase n=1 Tax=Acidobacteriaceae TaxID=204434 RepID=UPI00131C6D39|nr:MULTISPECIES: IS481 family transposase [Acidobacteriaceae]MDW5264148.1 IS481 family transposase [Edaphobacter sp.]
MDYHHHARLRVHGREPMCRAVVEGRLGLCEASAEHKISRQTAAKWVRRYREGGMAALADRSSRPHRVRHPVCSEQIVRVESLRRERWTGVRIAQATGLSRATVSRILQRLRLNKARHLEPYVPVVRYEHDAPGDLLHLDIKKFARIVKAGHRITGDPRDETRGAGWEFLYVAIDDHSRIAYTALYPDETANSSAAFLNEATTWFQRFGITTRRVLTDNGSCFYAHHFANACRDLGITHKRTRIYTPRTNGKAERFIQTVIREWAYARRYENSAERAASLKPWTHQYNWHRPHASLNQAPPISRSGLDVNNLLRHHS